MSNKTVTATVADTDILAEAYTAQELAEEHLAALQSEQQSTVQAMAAASTARDSTSYFALQKRQRELITELDFAEGVVIDTKLAVEEARLAKAQLELVPLYARMAAIRAEMKPLEDQLSAVMYEVSKRESIKRAHAVQKSPLLRQRERLEAARQQRINLESAPAVRSLQGFYR